jgi:hypothetical protein
MAKIPRGRGQSIAGKLKQATAKQLLAAGISYHLVIHPSRLHLAIALHCIQHQFYLVTLAFLMQCKRL